MSVLIRGMKMPKNCWECALQGNPALCIEFVDFSTRDERPEQCPLAPVPPHGDLIDREWLLDIALHLVNTAKNDDIANGMKWLWQYIIEAPPIIPEDDKDINVPIKEEDER